MEIQILNSQWKTLFPNKLTSRFQLRSVKEERRAPMNMFTALFSNMCQKPEPGAFPPLLPPYLITVPEFISFLSVGKVENFFLIKSRRSLRLRVEDDLGQIYHMHSKKGGSNEPPRKLLGRSGGILPRESLKIRFSEMRFPVFRDASRRFLIPYNSSKLFAY